jgi:hypothetical protein
MTELSFSAYYGTNPPEASLNGHFSMLSNMELTAGDFISDKDWPAIMVLIILTLVCSFFVAHKLNLLNRIKGVIKSTMAKARNPFQRVGLILLFISPILLIYTPIHFQFAKSPFVYWKYKELLVKEVPEPNQVPVGYYWENVNSGLVGLGWSLKEKPCPLTTQMFSGEEAPSYCKEKTKAPIGEMFLPHQVKISYYMQNNFDRYFREMSRPSGAYYNLNRFNILLVVLGLSLWFGWFDKLIRWVKSGNEQ